MLRLCQKGRKAYSASILIPNPISARFPLAPGYNSPSRSAKRYPFKCRYAKPIDLRPKRYLSLSFLILLYRSRQRKAIRLMEKEEKIKKDSILIFCGISDRVKRKGFETEHEEKELLWISKIWLLSYTLRSCAASQRQGIS